MEAYDMVMRHLNDEPSKPVLLLGPINSGKSALLTKIMDQEILRVIYLNCGLKDVSTPELMATELRNQARKLPSMLGLQFIKLLTSQLGPVAKLVQSVATFFGFSIKSGDGFVVTGQLMTAFYDLFLPISSSTNLAAVLDAYEHLLEKVPPGQQKPVIVVDEVNDLTRWKHKDVEKLKSLLNFLRRTCKEKERAHIVLASADFFMVSWLQSKGLDATQRRVEVLGDLTSDEAFVYVCGGKVRNRKGFEEDWSGLMAQSEETLALGMTPEEWKKVWSVCGGNMYLLKNCVASATQYNSWDEGVAQILSKPQMDVSKALKRPKSIHPPPDSTGPRIWEAKHYKAVLRLIAAHPYHAVRQEDAEDALRAVGIAEDVLADEVLLSMVEFNVLSLRPYSTMAHDIPREAFYKTEWGVEVKDSLVTMRSPAHLAAALILEKKFQNEDEAERNRAEEGNRQAKR